MVSASKDPRQNPDRRWWVVPAVCYLVVALGILLTLSSCSPRVVENIRYKRDTTYIVKRDSVRFYDRDSILIREKGDTIYQYVEKWRWRDRVRVDTIYRARVDSVFVERIKEVQIPKPLSWWENAKIRAFWYLLGAVLLLLLYVFRKPLLKLIRI
jgi:hypothetical protein